MSSRTLAHSLTSHKRAQAVEVFRSRVVWLAFGRLFFAWAAGWLMLWGCAILVWRAFHLPEAQVWWGALGAIPAAVGAGLCAARLAPAPSAVLAALDARSGAHGLMLLEEERGDLGAWANRLPDPPELRLSWRPGRLAGIAFLCALFVAGTFLVPVPAAAKPGVMLDLKMPIRQLQAQVDLLKETGLLDDPTAQAMQERFKQLQGTAQGENPAKTWEAMDHLGSQVQALADQANQEIGKDAKSTDAALQLASTLDARGGELSPDQLSAAREAQQNLENRAFAEATNGGLPGVKPPPGLQVPANALPRLDAAQRAQMRQFLQENRQALRQLADRMCQAGMCQGGQAGNKAGGLTPEQQEKLMQQIKNGQCPGGKNGGKGGGKGKNQPGQGGFNEHSDDEGPSNGLTWKDPSTTEGAGFDPHALDPAVDLRNSVKLSETATAPQADGQASSSGGGGLSDQAQGGGSAARQNVLPRHRKAVDQYFERPAK